MRRLFRWGIPALLLLLACRPAPAARPSRGSGWTLLVVDSWGRPSVETAREAHRISRQRRARAAFRWIRVGSPVPGPGPGALEPGPGDPRPEWDPEGKLVAGYSLPGVPRILLLDPEGRVRLQEAFLPPERLGYVVRNPEAAAGPVGTPPDGSPGREH